MAKTGTTNYAESSKYEWLIIVIAIFVLRIMPWLLAEYWYDEVLTLGDFALDVGDRGLWKSVFRNYPIANNHILSSAIYWIWLRVIGFNMAFEHFTRLPSLLFGTGLIALCVCHWRKWLGGRIANLGGLLLAASPVFGAYAYQIRGYSMSMFLCGLAISGLLEFNSGKIKCGQILMCTSCLLLPLVIPSNVLIILPIAATLMYSCRNWRDRIRFSIGPLLASFIGASYYFTIWPQFVNASKEPGGWSSAWLVAGNLILAFMLHGLALLIALGLRKVSQLKIKDEISESAFDKSLQKAADGMNPISPAVVFVTSIMTIALALLFSRKGQAPYPRVFLVFFVTMSYALLQSCANNKVASKSFPMLFIAIMFCGLVTERVSYEMTKLQLQAGISPNNLLQQYYRGNSDLRTAVSYLEKNSLLENAAIITDEYDFPTTRMYVTLNGGSPLHVYTRKEKLKWEFPFLMSNKDKSIFIIAKNRGMALSLLEYAGNNISETIITTIHDCGIRTLYRLENASRGETE